jgi:multiple sugar transport system substrate-binding protein
MQDVIDRCNQLAAGKYKIVYQVLPRTADDQRVQMVRRLAAKDDSMDILGMDVTWTQEFASAHWIREFTGADKTDVQNGTLPGPLASAEYDGKLYAAPNNTNVQLLWYRKDLVPTPPKTWAEMIQMSQQLKQQGKPYQVLTMGAQYEGLVVLFNSLVASAGGPRSARASGRSAGSGGCCAPRRRSSWWRSPRTRSCIRCGSRCSVTTSSSRRTASSSASPTTPPCWATATGGPRSA